MRFCRGAATAAVGSLGLVIAGVGAIVVPLAICAGLWVLLAPVNYFGCGTERPAGITARDLVGSYVSDDGARLELDAEGTFTASNMDISRPHQARTPLSGSGTWVLEPESDLVHDIQMSLDSESEHGYQYIPDLYISGSRADPWLYWYITDPDTCRLYRLDRVDQPRGHV